ncbi:MAG: pteridine reductase [Gammaproteobacteria bacterium]|nr:MAG: pteridine reductase [Gammaproteobacteria bacterium]
MQDNTSISTDKVALVTGAAKRVGAVIVRKLHSEGMNIILHYRSSRNDAQALQAELNEVRENSVVLIQAELLNTDKIAGMIREAVNIWGRLDVVINNASSFYPTPMGTVDEDQWEDIVGSNLKAPFFICQSAAEHLKKTNGCIINIVDIHAERPLKTYPIYSIAKAGITMLTRSMARELGPEIRVNGVAPGAILWPENIDEVTKQRIVSRTALKRRGDPQDVADTIAFLVNGAGYITGQIITVDGGRTLTN